MRIRGIPARTVAYSLPGLGLILLAVYILLFVGSFALAGPLFGFGVLVAVLGGGIATTTEYTETTAADRLIAPLRFRQLRRKLPFTHEVATQVHGVERIFDDGTAEMTDGRLVGLVRLEGRNTDLQTDDEARPMIGRLRTAIDEDVADFSFRLYSTSLTFDPAEITEPYEQQWHAGYSGEAWRRMRRYLRTLTNWETAISEELWDARDWKHYAVVSVSPDDENLSLPSFDDELIDESRLEALRRRQMQREVQDRLRKLGGAFQQVPGVSAESIGPAEHATLLARRWSGTEHSFDDESVSDPVDVAVWPPVDHPVRSQQPDQTATHQPGAVAADSTLDDRSGGIAAVTTPRGPSAAHRGSVERPTTDGGSQPAMDRSLDGTSVASSTRAHANDAVATELSEEEQQDASFFARLRDGLFTTIPFGDSDSSGERTNRLADLLAPSTYDAREGHVCCGEQFARTYWIASWPTQPREKFLRELYTLRGVDVEVTLRCESRKKATVMDELKDTIGEVDADIAERREANDITAMLEERDMDPYTEMFILLHETPAQPWELTGYVTVRAGTRRALDRAEEYLEDDLLTEQQVSLDLTKRQALDDACSSVTDVLERTPAQLTAVTSDHRQDALFKSSAPTGRDVYAEQSWRTRSSLTLSGTIAAAFPPVAPTIRQDDGVMCGRLASNGSAVVADGFEPGPGHQLVVGDSGSGKTTFVEKKVLRWWAQADDRTLILCDTMGEFAGLTELCNGQRITLDGSQIINPLHIEATPETILQHLDVAPFEMKFQEAVNFVLSVIAPDPTLADRFAPLVKDAIRATYRQAGVIPREPSTHRPENSPTMADLRATVRDMGENPSQYVSSRLEEQEITTNAGPLLRRLSGFAEDGDMRALTGESEARIEPGSVTYLDLQQIEGLGSAADKSTMLMLMLGQVYQAVKRAPGRTVFVIDEAHYLLQSREMLGWLQQAARHWRHYDAGLWFVSQHPSDFVDGRTQEIQEYLDAIRGQTTTTTFFSTDDLTDETATAYGLNDPQSSFIRGTATRGEDGLGYTECLMGFEEREGWHRLQIRLSPLEQRVFDYDPETHGAFDQHFDQQTG
ncbi:VirB4 family type IV secretion system protein [Halomarina oriensis]|uniref:TraC-like domain-containing protein n=1 Tax=Halomarina oriensis TaxID=671145 RepID=A0A6B0GMW6_9EURY|nr:hypothetical protein [Halomarina oriensis]MWG35281.1 hypothetical protein [Halomarina oriensis]